MFPGDRISQGHLNRGAECAETRDAKGLEGVAENDFSAYKASQNALGCTAEGVEGVRNGRGIPLPIRLGGLGSVVSSPSGVRSRTILVHLKHHRMLQVALPAVN